MAKQKDIYVCEQCGHESPKWLGQCPSCKAWNSFVQKQVVEISRKAVQSLTTNNAKVQNLANLPESESNRITTGLAEFDAVLGGGLLPDQVVLLSGEPGIGKSTLALQLSLNLVPKIRILYVSAEETASQVGGRARRISKDASKLEEIRFLNTPSLQKILETIETEKPQVVVIDSVQTIYDEEVAGLPGNVAQVRSVAARLVYTAKSSGFCLVLIGHVNKDGDIAGPKTLEHVVDTVVTFAGEALMGYRLLRAQKNRFGQVGEVGILVMSEAGLKDIDVGQNIFISNDGEAQVGIARTVVMDGNRPLLIEMQALVSKTIYPYPKRVADGLPLNRLQTICAIVSKYSKLRLSDSDVYLRSTGGYQVNDPAADLAIAMAIISSAKQKTLAADAVYIGELSLAGRVLPVSYSEARAKEAQKFGSSNIFASVALKAGKKVSHLHDLT